MKKKIFLWAVFLLVLLFVAGNFWPYKMPANVITEPDSRLNVVSDEVENFDENLKALLDELTSTLAYIDNPFKVFGLAISAPQIGVNKRAAVIKNAYGDYLALVNPEILEAKWRGPWLENCFSVNGAHFTNRAFWVKILYKNIEGKEREEIFVGPKAAIIQQEIDHLNGVLIGE